MWDTFEPKAIFNSVNNLDESRSEFYTRDPLRAQDVQHFGLASWDQNGELSQKPGFLAYRTMRK